ncbi:MAG: histidine kinase [Deltaproteobacteria bacterium]|nr:histidine kinase [Deltaproteobacteria bacterium]
MNAFDLFITLVERFGLIVTACFVLMQLGAFRKILQKRADTYEKILITLIFGVFGVIGTNAGINVMEAIANFRGMAVITAGLLGGPFVGLGAGLIAGGYRLLLGGFTAFGCGFATLIEGIGAGLIFHYRRGRAIDWKLAGAVAIIGESLQMLLVLGTSTPFTDALTVVQIVAFPVMLLNALGTAIFIQVINIIRREEEKAGAEQAQKALRIARETVGHLRTGLNERSAQETAEIIHRIADVAGVAITDRHGTLAFRGTVGEHKPAGTGELSPPTAEVIKTGAYRVIGAKKHGRPTGPDRHPCSGIIVPLSKKDVVAGTLTLYKEPGSRITRVDRELAIGLAHLFSTQLELEEIQKQAQVLTKAEIKALQAQINPHFLFNALNTISSLCRSDMEKARDLIIHLGNFFRGTFKSSETGLVSLEEELENVRSYLTIEKARFGERITVIYSLHHNSGSWSIPPFTLQPLVENAIKHGLSGRDRGGTVSITTDRDGDDLRITVEDTGIGMSGETVKMILNGTDTAHRGSGIALANIQQRLTFLYGPEYGKLTIESTEGAGTKMSLKIPAGGKRES